LVEDSHTVSLTHGTPITKVDTVGSINNLADYHNKKIRPDKEAMHNNSSTNTSGPSFVQTSTNHAMTTSAPSYSFPQSSKPTCTTGGLRGSSRSVSPAKPTAIPTSTPDTATSISNHLGLQAANVTQRKTLHPTSVLMTTKPTSPLSTFSLTASSSKPTTTNITVSTLPPVTNTADQQVLRESTIETEPINSPKPPMQATGFDTIVEGEELEIPISARGDSASTSLPMIRIMEEYTGETIGNDISMQAWVNLLATMPELEPKHVKRIKDRNKGITKYRLSESLLATLSRITMELQVFVERAARLIEERTRHFTVDPKDTLLHILRGTSSLPQLNIAWKTIQKHLELGHHTLQKYALQFQQTPHEENLLLLLISTLPDIHSELRDIQTADQ